MLVAMVGLPELQKAWAAPTGSKVTQKLPQGRFQAQ